MDFAECVQAANSNAISCRSSEELRRSQLRNRRRKDGSDGPSMPRVRLQCERCQLSKGRRLWRNSLRRSETGSCPVLRNLPMTAMQSHRACLHADADQILASARRWPGFRLRMADGQLILGGELRLKDLRITYPCDTCMLCRTNAPPSRHTAHQAGAKVEAVKSEIPMSSIEWLIIDPWCLNLGTTGAAPSPVSLGGNRFLGQPLTPDQQPADQKYMATVVPSVCGTIAHLTQ